MIDSHCHLDHEPLHANIKDIVKRSKEVGISKLLTICTTFSSFEKIKSIIKEDEIIFGTFGIHPHETKTDIVDKNMIVENVKQNQKIIGVGETGLDFFYNNSDKIIVVTVIKNANNSDKTSVKSAQHESCTLIHYWQIQYTVMKSFVIYVCNFLHRHNIFKRYIHEHNLKGNDAPAQQHKM